MGSDVAEDPAFCHGRQFGPWQNARIIRPPDANRRHIPMNLLIDALDRTLREPQCARRWHSMMAIWEAGADESDKRSVLDALKAAPYDDVRAEILRLSFLGRACGDSRYEHSAAAAVLAATPDDPDRLAAFMAFEWLSALQDLGQRAEFVATLAASRVPQMAVRQMEHAAMAIPAGFVPRVPQDIRRVAVVVPFVGNRLHTPSVMAVEQCIVLARAGMQVKIFSAQELTPPDAGLFRGDGRELKLPPLDAAAWARNLPTGVGMTVSDSRFGMTGRWRNMMPALAEFDPDVVLLVGLYSPLAAALHTRRPTLGISVNTVAPIAPLDVWLTGDPQPGSPDPWSNAFPPPRRLYHPYRVRRSQARSGVDRAALGLGPASVVWVTAGFRLEHEIRGNWAMRMLHLLAEQPDAVWLLVGGDGKLPPALQHAPAGRVLALATRKDVPDVLRCSDVYVNPPRMGGGFSVVEAMAEGLPVVAFAGCDGGDKVGESAAADIDGYLASLATLTANPDLRRDRGSAMRQRFHERFDLDASGPALLAACRLAASLAGERLTGPS